ncbi:MAG: hypothetical protein HQ568_06015 [Calditrichaeota bacterium]|nr:hypothetical protein [Calditrichota bacterium]
MGSAGTCPASDEILSTVMDAQYLIGSTIDTDNTCCCPSLGNDYCYVVVLTNLMICANFIR